MKKLALNKETLQVLGGAPLGQVAGALAMSRLKEGCLRTENGCGGITVDLCGDSMVNCTSDGVTLGG